MYSVRDVIDILDCEGLDYSLTEYMSLDRIEDPELRGLCESARDAILALEKFLKKHDD